MSERLNLSITKFFLCRVSFLATEFFLSGNFLLCFKSFGLIMLTCDLYVGS